VTTSPIGPSGRTNSRANGLDTLRAAAITLVFMYHYKVFVSRENTFGWLSEIGWVGVDLFFVLSGYLIANQIFSGLARGQSLSPKFFYARRAFRTLPVFWVVLAFYFLLPSIMGGKTPPPLWTFLTFTQNFGLQPGTAFSHAWSLCIEEQFYLVLPLVIFAGARLRAGRMQGWLLLLSLVALGVTARIVLWQTYGRESTGKIDGYYPNVYYATLGRFDEFIPGIAVAMLKNFHRPLWDRLMQHGHALLAAGTIATITILTIAFHFYYIDGYGYGFFMSAFGYSLVAMAFAILVAAALSPSSWLYRLRIPGAYQIALWSYSLYLSHKAIGHILKEQLKPFALSPGMLLLAISVTSLLAGYVLYRLVEAPFMALRDRQIPSSFSARGSSGAEQVMPAKP
jgi:peptidoglycan/LPS O-acetylase OafA/YrhL